ncbi:ribosome maturation factor RimM [Loigolactobacillus zhaoyuanensis]|uniref:Ribosome maturation factor RimM n=1 Tax=Loigolactobacillus zhaoyuanensis TaxID=2486017 RepID=A0ABW8U938_9LACO|nr:ribosome maturation factor RimM [Loigolactobacillus zhaoyuanensis]
MSEKYYTVGKIVNTHGIRGEVRVMATTDFPAERFQPGGKLYIQPAGKLQALTIKTHRRHKNFNLLSFVELPDLTAVEPIKGQTVLVAGDDRQELAPDEGYYYRDIIGLKIVDQATNADLGTVKEILSPGANDVWVVARPGKKDWLLPYLKQVVLDVDLATQQATVDLPEGLIDDAD